jgi:hypothetical protein
MDVTKYAQAGYGCIFVETHEVKRAVNTIRVNSNLGKVVWNMIQGIVKDPFKDSANTDAKNNLVLITLVETIPSAVI